MENSRVLGAHAGLFNGEGYGVNTQRRHQVNACNAVDPGIGGNKLGTDGGSFRFCVLCSVEAVYQGIGNCGAPQVLPHPACGPRRCKWADADQYTGTFRNPVIDQPGGVVAYHVDIEAELGLKKSGAGVDLGQQAIRLPAFVCRVHRCVGAADKQLWPGFDFPARWQDAVVAHLPGAFHQVAAFIVEDGLCLRLIPGGGVVTAQNQQVLYTERSTTQQVGLQGDPVAVAAGELQYRFDPVLEQQTGGDHARHMCACAGAVGNVRGIDMAFKHGCLG